MNTVLPLAPSGMAPSLQLTASPDAAAFAALLSGVVPGAAAKTAAPSSAANALPSEATPLPTPVEADAIAMPALPPILSEAVHTAPRHIARPGIETPKPAPSATAESRDKKAEANPVETESKTEVEIPPVNVAGAAPAVPEAAATATAKVEPTGDDARTVVAEGVASNTETAAMSAAASITVPVTVPAITAPVALPPQQTAPVATVDAPGPTASVEATQPTTAVEVPAWQAAAAPFQQKPGTKDDARTERPAMIEGTKQVSVPAFELNLQSSFTQTARTDAPLASPTTPDMAAAPRQLTVDGDGRWLEQLARDIETLAADGGRLRFVLSPERLGQLDVDIARGPDNASIQLTASNEQAAQLIAAEQPRLLEELRQQGVRIASTDLTAGHQHGSRREPQPTPHNNPRSQDQAMPDHRPASHRPARGSARFA